MTPGDVRTPRPGRGIPLGWILLAAVLAWAFAVHHGIGPVPAAGATAWWHPRGFVTDWLTSSSLGLWLTTPAAAVLAFSLPAVALAAAIFATTTSAVARTLATAAVLATLLFLFYGTGENRPMIWRFFHWRGSAVMAGTALVVAAALCAPLLARSWLRLGWPARVASYLPLVAISVALQRSITGTDPALPFAISPWPVIPFFGLEIADGLIAAVLASVALAAASGAALRERPPLALVGLVIAFAAPAAWVRLGLPNDGPLQLATVALAGLALLATAARRSEDAAAARSSASRSFAVGALLVALPLLCGHWLVQRDYTLTRSERAQRIIDALRRHFDREASYPETLDELVASKELAEIPRPQIGFGSDANQSFTYQNFGTSYILEFAAQRWVQCAYNPPWADDEAEEESGSGDAAPPAAADPGDGADAALAGANDPEGDADADGASGAWSCPKKPPELW